ncbi:reverse transcriptase domain-containing protein, partial [Tanacetum coccineum]
NRRSRSPSPVASVFKRLKQNRPPSPRPRPRKEGGVFNRLGGKKRSASARFDSRHQVSYEKETEVQPRKHHHRDMSSQETGEYSESEDSEGGHWKSKSRRHRSNTCEDDLSQPWTCEERNPFTPRIRHFNFPRTMMPSHVKTYNGSGDPEDHLKLFQASAKTDRWAMPTWCHMFNSTLTGNARVWFDKLSRESIDSYEDLRTAFRENYLQHTKHIKDPVEIHHIKQIDGESTKDFMERYKAEILDVEGAPECMKISGFMHGITHPELIKRLYEKIPRSMDEMYRVTTSFLQWEVAAFSHTPAPWKQPEGGNKPNFKKGLKNKQRSDRKPDRSLSHTWNNRQNGYKKDPCRTIHGTQNVKIPGKRRNGNDTKQQSHPDGIKGRKELCALAQTNTGICAGSQRILRASRGTWQSIASKMLRGHKQPFVRQKKRGQAPERNKAIQEEVEKLVDAGIMKEVHYHSWLSNPVMVKKHDGSWRMCVDFKDLNKACPQDGYPLPEIDWKVESLCGYPFKCFLDAYKGYHQIKLEEEVEEIRHHSSRMPMDILYTMMRSL